MPAADRLQKQLGFRFRDPDLLQQALTHRSAGKTNNERLEFVGDAVLGMVIAEQLYQRFPRASEGQMSRLRASLVKREALAGIAHALSLGDYLILGEGEQRSGGHSRDSILADAVEAILGASYQDQGFAASQALILRLWAESLAGLKLEQEQKDPKTRLQEWLQARQHEVPEYAIVRVTGKQHQQVFHVECRIDTLDLAVTASGGNRRKAEQAAAAAMLEKLGD